MVFINGFTFDFLNKYEQPNIILSSLSKTEIGIFTPDIYKNLNLQLRFNAFSEASFTLKSHYHDDSINKDIFNPYYKLVKKNQLILLPKIGWFIIDNISENIEHEVTEKIINCYSYEKIFAFKNINLLDGTFKFYNNLNPDDEETLMGKIMAMFPAWKLNYVDETLWNKYRTFEIPDSNVYDFLMKDVEKAYECIFDFNTIDSTINIYTSKTAIKPTDIVLTFDNLIKKISVQELDSPIITALGIYGKDNLDIRNVNPLGTCILYNFEHYYSSMTKELVDAIKKWESKIGLNRIKYSELLTNLKTKNYELLSLKVRLTDLESEKKAIEQIRTVQMPNVARDIIKQLHTKEDEIQSQENLIISKQTEITQVAEMLKQINEDLSFKKNFTNHLLQELDIYIYESAYRNENFVKTKVMSFSEIQDMSMDLLQQGQKELKKLSQPSYSFSMDAVNFLFLEEYETFIKALSLGCLINVESKPNEWLQPILLEMDINYDSPTDFNLTFGNRFRLETAEWSFADLFHENNKTTTNVNINSNLWGQPVKSGLVDEVSDYMNNALDLSKQDIINNKNSEVTFGEFGIRLRRKLVEGDNGFVPNKTTYDPIQVWLYNKGMGFTTDNWNSCKAFFGTITNPSGGKSTGLIAPTIVGNLVAGNQLQITNENNSFKVDGNGAELINAKFTLATLNNKAKITLNPQEGIKIQTNNNGWKDSFYVDTQGDLIMSGKLSAFEGNIGGWRIGKDGLYNDNNGDNIKSNGYGQLSLLRWTPSSATFDGNIYAKNLIDKVKNNNIDEDAVDTENICRHAITPNKLDRVYATEAQFDRLKADVADVNKLIVNKANISDLNAIDAKIENLDVVGRIRAGTIDVSKLSIDGHAGDLEWIHYINDITYNKTAAFVGASIKRDTKTGFIKDIKFYTNSFVKNIETASYGAYILSHR